MIGTYKNMCVLGLLLEALSVRSFDGAGAPGRPSST